MLYTLRREQRRHYAICECGWESRWMTTPGMAGAEWDRHNLGDHDVIDLRVRGDATSAQ